MNTGNFTFEERCLMCIYNHGNRTDLIKTLTDMQEFLEEDEEDLRQLTVSTVKKLQELSDSEFEGLDLIPDFDAYA